MKKTKCNKEFKVRIDSVKCAKYKTFQPELPTKKFLFTGEKESIHNLKLLSDNSCEQNKATSIRFKVEHVEEEPETEEVEKVDEIIKAITGMFRDTIRRIDIVLVVEDDVNELMNNIKFEFLSYIVRAGLEVEIEPGVMEIHKNLTFIKIHAPDSVLEKYGTFFGTKRYFADTRYDYMGLTKNYDKEWVMFVRQNYNTPYRFSNHERSIIVYKILLHLSFGDNLNYYGIERLLNRRVILDAFAVHDGPYFVTPDQTISGSNARQILNYYWSRIQNLFQQQPIHLIHEYFGPRVAFYFAFYEFFIKALKVAALLGIFNIFIGTLNLTTFEVDIKKGICESSVKICRSCEQGCPPRICNEYCLSAQINLILDHLLLPLYSVLTISGSFIFLRLWQRRESFLKWIWEVGRPNSYYQNAVRPLFHLDGGERRDPFISGLKGTESVIQIFLRYVISKTVVLVYVFTTVPIMHNTYRLYEAFSGVMKTAKHSEKYREYIVMSLFQTFYILITTVFERIYHHIIYFLVKCENHSSYKKFNKSIVIKKIGVKLIFQYALIVYFSVIYGNQPRYRRCSVGDLTSFSTIAYLMELLYDYEITDVCDTYSFCFPYTCIIEVATLLATVLIVTQVVYTMFDYIFSLRTDYNLRKYKDSEIPCWEREYRLGSWTEEDMVRKYINLAAQFTLVTWFIIGFPLGPLILYLMNVWNIRHEARKLLLATRRPLLIKTPGTQMNYVFYFIAWFSVLTNAVYIAIVTRTGLRYIMYKFGKKQNELFKFFHYYYAAVLEENIACFAPDMLEDNTEVSLLRFYDLIGINNFYSPEFFKLLVSKMFIMMLLVLVTIVIFLIINYTIPRHREVETLRATEQKIKNLYYHYDYKSSKKK